MDALSHADEAPQPLIIEVHDGHFAHVHRVQRLPCRMGRAVDNDIVLSGNTVSPYHAELVEEGGRLWLRDLDSDNGTRANGRDLSGTLAVPEQGLAIQLGSAHLNLRTPHTPLAPTRRSGCRDLRTCLLLSWPAVLVLTLVVALLGALDARMEASEQPGVWEYLGMALIWCFNLFIWGAVFATVSRLTTRRAEWRGNLVLSAWVLLLVDGLAPMLVDGLDYALALNLRVWLNMATTTILMPLLLYGFARRVLDFGPGASRAYTTTGLLLGLAFSAMIWADARDGFSGPSDHFHAYYDDSLSTRDWRLAADVELDEFMNAARDLKAE